MHRGVPGHRLCILVVGVAGSRFRQLRSLLDKPLQTTPINGQHLVFARFDVPGRDHIDTPLAVGGRDVVVLGDILGHMVELPAMGV